MPTDERRALLEVRMLAPDPDIPGDTRSNVHAMRHRVVARDPEAEGSVVLARRRAVGRGFGRPSRRGGLARDRACRLDVSAARPALVGILSGFEAPLDQMPARAPAW